MPFMLAASRFPAIRYGLIAKMDLIEADEGAVTPVDYKRGAPRTKRSDGELEAVGCRSRAVGRAGTGAARQRLPLRRSGGLLRDDQTARAVPIDEPTVRLDAGHVAAGPRNGGKQTDSAAAGR